MKKLRQRNKCARFLFFPHEATSFLPRRLSIFFLHNAVEVNGFLFCHKYGGWPYSLLKTFFPLLCPAILSLASLPCCFKDQKLLFIQRIDNSYHASISGHRKFARNNASLNIQVTALRSPHFRR